MAKKNEIRVNNKVLKEAMDIMSDSLKNPDNYKDDEMMNKKKEAERTFFNCMKDAKFIAPVQFNPKPKVSADKRTLSMLGVKINFLLLKNPQGQSYFPVFTDMEEFKKWNNPSKPDTILVSAQDYEKMFEQEVHKDTCIILNPFSHGLIVKQDLIKALSASKQSVRLEDGSQPKQAQANVNLNNAVFSEPSIYPTKMVNALYDYCEGNEMIERADLRMMSSNGSNAFLVIVKHHGKAKEIFDDMGKLASPLSKNNTPVAFMENDEKTPEKALENSIPFFERFS
ncbi:MAG: enhanced serine sensitivity protein SseB C-terminal domain-containing protein [Erysipelotrichaceae bacterium]|nr:enhanced serine sensitivity protein SseB C-terminal domain-containing protein [Erysipelotrichaceae bacterium]